MARQFALNPRTEPFPSPSGLKVISFRFSLTAIPVQGGMRWLSRTQYCTVSDPSSGFLELGLLDSGAVVRINRQVQFQASRSAAHARRPIRSEFR